MNWKGAIMVLLEKMKMHTVTRGNYVTSVNGMIHPNRIMKEHDFLYMLDGNWEIFEDGVPYLMTTDDLLILPAGRHHYGKKMCNPGNRHMYIHVLPTEIENFFNTSQLKTDMKYTPASASDMFSCPSLLHCQAATRIRQYFQEIISVSWNQTPERENRLSLLFSLLLCELSQLEAQKSSQILSDPMIEEIIQLIHSTPQTFFSAAEIASQYYICPRTLNNRFHKSCGKTFPAFQMETKLEMVRQFLLSQPDTKLREAAVNYGFYDEFHLSKAFKKQFGLSPSQYRQIYQAF